MKWPPMYDCKQQARRASKSSNKKLKWEYQCAKCKKWFADKDIQADHKIPAGTLRSFSDLPGFVERLFCEVDGYEMLCKKKCHHKKTQDERTQSKL